MTSIQTNVKPLVSLTNDITKVQYVAIGQPESEGKKGDEDSAIVVPGKKSPPSGVMPNTSTT